VSYCLALAPPLPVRGDCLWTAVGITALAQDLALPQGTHFSENGIVSAHFLFPRAYLKDHCATQNDDTHCSLTGKPDFLARQQTLFGSRVLPDSQSILEEMRADRF